MTDSLSRRGFIACSAAAAVATGCGPAIPSEWDFLTPQMAATLAVLADQIIPADDYPSASQAGAVAYMDRQLARHYRNHQDAYRQGLEMAARLAKTSYGRLAEEMTAAERMAWARQIERNSPEFFSLVREHTMEGYYGTPRHGGNRDAVSWRMLGLEEPPLHGRAQYGTTKDGAQ